MGLFDTLRCAYPLPDPPAQAATFQTKDLGGEMGAYTITRAGRLLAHRARWESIPEEEWLVGSLREVSLGDIDLAYHGDIGIYTRGADGVRVHGALHPRHGRVDPPGRPRGGRGMTRPARVALAPLAAEGALVTRAQARALLAGCERAGVLELDFAGVEAIGQGFADELFRVWPRQHPATRVSAVNATEAVLRMIRHVRARGDLPQPREADP